MRHPNQQAPEAVNKEATGNTLDVIRIWETIQGEGPFVGTPAVFVRLAGCNLRCPMCDTNYTTGRKLMSTGDVVKEITNLRTDGVVVLTGGEPFRQPIVPLVNALAKWSPQLRIQIETNGIFLRNIDYDTATIVCSPKTNNLDAKSHMIRAYKYIIEAGNVHPEDHLPNCSLGYRHLPARPPKSFLRSNIYVQPLDVQDPAANKRNLDAAVQSCIKGGYRLCLQTHKMLGLD